MKTIIISSIIAGLLGLSTINNVFSKDNNNTRTYQNVIENKAEKSKTISLYEGENDMNLKPVKQYVIKYIGENKPVEKITYRWNSRDKKWIETDKYEYIYSEAGGLETMTHLQWNENENIWIVDNDLDILLLDVDKELLTANRNF
ncbi:MAG: DUF3836 domain-containing protein [Dysgonomonas sp.]|nr:DUF3836 domain-containing protein [Dysgonomonas sp.]